ncbi:MAG TPA: sigma-54 dependent transcriptional regulator [Longimicrobiaceae bacterium]|nr:sigma-54 dependent transcriptional regulator [Longimicrobiaceae bacterium]
MSSILIVDDEPNIRRMVASLLRSDGYRVLEADGAREGLAVITAEEPDALLMDLVMPGEGGLDALPGILEIAPELPVIMMSGKASLSDAVRATKLGAFHFLEKPLSPEAVLLTLRSALDLRQARELNRALREQLGEGEEMVGSSAPMQKLRALIERVAPTDARVLITGESGTGKELVAAAIHRHSDRAGEAFVRVNCAAIPRDLVESEMFGHERGAFTGATERRRGRFELADGGILFLDEVGDLGLDAQAKLLRALEGGSIERVGGGEPIAVDVRVLAATNKDLSAEVAEGRFREDLYFRLNVIPIHLPALRERREDIPALVQHFLERLRARNALRPPRLTQPALDALARHPWPGNIRELANIVERLMILHPATSVGAGDVRAVLAGPESNGPTPGGYAEDDDRPLSDRLDEYERRIINGALKAAEGNIAEAARRLQTDRANLYRRMRRLDLQP